MTEYTDLNNYIEKLTKTILSASLVKGRDLQETLLENITFLLDNNNNSLQRKQLLFMIKGLDKNYKDESEGLKVNIEGIINDTIRSNYNLELDSEEQDIIIEALLDNRIYISEKSLIMKLDRDEAEKILKSCYSIAKVKLDKELSSCNFEETLYAVYGAADVLSHASNLSYSKMKLNENSEKDYGTSNDFSLLMTSLSYMKRNELLQASYIIGSQKYYCDMLFNYIYRNYHVDGISEGTGIADVSILFKYIGLMAKFDLILQSSSLLYENNEYIFIEDFKINQSGNFNKKLEEFYNDVIDFKYDEESTKLVFEKYKLIEGFNSDSIFSLINGLERNKSEPASRVTTSLQTYSYNELKDFTSKVCSIDDDKVNNFLKSLTLAETSTDKFNFKEKVSVTPIVQLKNERVLISIPMLLQSAVLFNARLLQQSFTDNNQLKKFIQKNYDEVNITKIEKSILDKGIPCWANVYLNKVKSKELREEFNVKGNTTELDIAYIYDKKLYVLEYKTWRVSLYSVRDFLNELKKVNNHAIRVKNALCIVQKNQRMFETIFGEQLRDVEEIKLVMVFQNPNAYNYFNNDSEISAISYFDLVARIENGEMNL